MSFALIGAGRKIRFSHQKKRGHHAEAENRYRFTIKAKALTGNVFGRHHWGDWISLYHQLYTENYIDENRQTTESGSGVYEWTPAGTTNAAYRNGTNRSATIGTFYQAGRTPLRA
jgi:hypothetical protein